MSKATTTDDNDSTDAATPLTTEAFHEYADVGRILQLSDDRTAHVADVGMSLIGYPSVTVVMDNGKTRKAVVGTVDDNTDNGGLAWVSDVEDNDNPSMSDVDTAYGNLQFGKINVNGLLKATPTTDDRDTCPVCGATTHFCQQWAALRDHAAVELRKCSPDGDDAPRHMCVYETPCKRTDATAPHDVTLVTPDGETVTETVHGFYQRRDTGDWNGFAAVTQGDDDPRGIYTAREVASFINGKMNSDGDAERFGVAQMGGSGYSGVGDLGSGRHERPMAVTWWDENDSLGWCAKTQFVPIGDFYEIEQTTVPYGVVPSDDE